MDLQEIKNCLDKIDTQKLSELKDIIFSKKWILIIGNGGSNAISSHISQDYTKVLGKKSLSFSDSSRLTCYVNDFGSELAYVKFIEHFKEPDMLVILLSSSGNSMNIINAAKFCVENVIDFITLSGFSKDNKLKEFDDLSILNFHVDSFDYGVVECTHEIILHSVI